MALTVGTDTYISVADATTYLATQLGAGAWTDATAGEHEQALRMACTRLERLFYVGDPTDSSQTLRWPRTDVYDQHGTALDSAAVPQVVKDAQCWEAAYLLEWNDREAGRSEAEQLQQQGVSSVKLGDVSYALAGKRESPFARALGPQAFQMVGTYLRREPASIRTGLEDVGSDWRVL